MRPSGPSPEYQMRSDENRPSARPGNGRFWVGRIEPVQMPVDPADPEAAGAIDEQRLQLVALAVALARQEMPEVLRHRIPRAEAVEGGQPHFAPGFLQIPDEGAAQAVAIERDGAQPVEAVGARVDAVESEPGRSDPEQPGAILEQRPEVRHRE